MIRRIGRQLSKPVEAKGLMPDSRPLPTFQPVVLRAGGRTSRTQLRNWQTAVGGGHLPQLPDAVERVACSVIGRGLSRCALVSAALSGGRQRGLHELWDLLFRRLASSVRLPGTMTRKVQRGDSNDLAATPGQCTLPPLQELPQRSIHWTAVACGLHFR